MTNGRLSREQFFRTLAALDETALRKALWTLYWRGSASVQQRILAIIDPATEPTKRNGANRVDAESLLAEVREFTTLARNGAYLAGDRRVTPKQRTRWRYTFQRLAKSATDGLAGRDVDAAASAMAMLIDLANDMRDVNYFRSDDPLAAARFVVSDSAAAMWSAIRREHGLVAFCEQASGQLLRWESAYGWTRRGEGWVAEREVALADVIAGLLPTADAWGEFADHYLRALGRVVDPRSSGEARRVRQQRHGDLHLWHDMLRKRLAHGEYEDRLDALEHHPALGNR
ncbi:MAG: hypothetical protein QM695_13165 [Micropruina sp.]